MAMRRQSKISLDRGSELLEERIRFCDGRCRSNPIRNFSADQICKAIEDYREIHPIQIQIDFQWKRGVLDGRPFFIKVYASGGEEVYRDIVVSSQMSSHNNALKLLGCCLEIPEGPALVYEYAENGCLNSHIRYGSLPWGTRLKIAKEIANAVTYLHTAFPRPIIHRDIKPENIFLNKNQAAKLVDFSCSISIPEEKTDVFSFGVLLLVLLTGRAPIQGEIHLKEYEAVDPMNRGNGGEAIDQQQLEAAIELALRCTSASGEDRPLMIEVAKELQRIERSITAAT